ncbi:MAG: hypothetical protein JW902_00650 [Syntrophaceae bacterium]|nr:hypothetical protein [Syntrophaceae bacterium]
MNGKMAVEVIKQKFGGINNQVKIRLQKGKSFNATMTEEGILVDNLSTQPLLPWIVFEETIELLVRKGGRAKKGNAMGYRLGDASLPLDSIEGHIAFKVYGKNTGDTLFRRISPISAILVWAGLCDTSPGELFIRKDKFKA